MCFNMSEYATGREQMDDESYFIDTRSCKIDYYEVRKIIRS